MPLSLPAALMVSVSGFRGRVGDPLTPELVAGLAAAFGAFLRKEGLGETVCVGRDSRTSGPMFLRAVVAGLQSVGTRVIDVLAGAGLHLLPWLLAPEGRLDPELLRDLLELRVALLGFTAELAAKRAEDLAPLTAALRTLQEARGVEAVAEAEFAFFGEMVHSSGNRVLGLIGNAVAQVWRQNAPLFEPLFGERMDTQAHEQVLQAIRARDPVAARRAYEAHGLTMASLA